MSKQKLKVFKIQPLSHTLYMSLFWFCEISSLYLRPFLGVISFWLNAAHWVREEERIRGTFKLFAPFSGRGWRPLHVGRKIWTSEDPGLAVYLNFYKSKVKGQLMLLWMASQGDSMLIKCCPGKSQASVTPQTGFTGQLTSLDLQ